MSAHSLQQDMSPYPPWPWSSDGACSSIGVGGVRSQRPTARECLHVCRKATVSNHQNHLTVKVTILSPTSFVPFATPFVVVAFIGRSPHGIQTGTKTRALLDRWHHRRINCPPRTPCLVDRGDAPLRVTLCIPQESAAGARQAAGEGSPRIANCMPHQQQHRSTQLSHRGFASPGFFDEVQCSSCTRTLDFRDKNIANLSWNIV